MLSCELCANPAASSCKVRDGGRPCLWRCCYSPQVVLSPAGRRFSRCYILNPTSLSGFSLNTNPSILFSCSDLSTSTPIQTLFVQSNQHRQYIPTSILPHRSVSINCHFNWLSFVDVFAKTPPKFDRWTSIRRRPKNGTLCRQLKQSSTSCITLCCPASYHKRTITMYNTNTFFSRRHCKLSTTSKLWSEMNIWMASILPSPPLT